MRGLLIAVLLTSAAAPLSAQTAPATTSYGAAFFAQFAPSNALQIVQRIPGFTLEQGDQDVRGFGQAAGNVVINGQRPSSKSDTLETILARIPASRVLRVEIAPGDRFGSELSNRPQVANLILTAAGGLAGTTTGTVRRSFTGRILPEGSVSALAKRGSSTFNAAIEVNNNQTTEEGTDRLTSRPSGAQTEFRRKVNHTRDPNGSVTASWAYDGGANRTAHLNGSAALERFSLTQNNAVQPTGGLTRDDRLTQRYHRREFEIGGDVTRPFAGGGLKLIGLATRRHRLNRDVSLNRVGPAVTGGFAQTLDDQRDETVARIVWSRSNLAGWNVETGAEGAINKLDSNVDLLALSAGGGSTRIDLPVDQAVVEEHRGEAFVNANRNLTKALRLDAGLVYETSRLKVSGDATALRDLDFLKPKATLDWRGKSGWHAQLSVARTVAQLRFEDFISAAELSNSRVNGGNADLVPQRAWEVLATVERPILGDGLVKVELGYDLISLLQDRVPTPAGFDAPGNLGDGRELIARGTVDAPLSRFGIKGGRLKAYVSLVDTSVRDPYTLTRRPFSGNSQLYFETSFRQDLGKYAWGVSMYGSTSSTVYRLDELDRFRQQVPSVSLFAEYRPDAKTTLTLGADNITDASSYRNRTFFAPSRANPQPYLFEYRERNRHVVPYLTLKRSMG